MIFFKRATGPGDTGDILHFSSINAHQMDMCLAQLKSQFLQLASNSMHVGMYFLNVCEIFFCIK